MEWREFVCLVCLSLKNLANKDLCLLNNISSRKKHYCVLNFHFILSGYFISVKLHLIIYKHFQSNHLLAVIFLNPDILFVCFCMCLCVAYLSCLNYPMTMIEAALWFILTFHLNPFCAEWHAYTWFMSDLRTQTLRFLFFLRTPVRWITVW